MAFDIEQGRPSLVLNPRLGVLDALLQPGRFLSVGGMEKMDAPATNFAFDVLPSILLPCRTDW